MAVQVSYPGVYIEEFAPGAPIEGVGTSTAAFIGVAEKGDVNSPIQVTSWDQFAQIFGGSPVPGFFLWYAARGFFDNGGQVCYIVRASNGVQGTAMLQNEDSKDLVLVRARQPGTPAPSIGVTLTPLLPAGSPVANVYRPQATPFNVVAGDPRQITIGGATPVIQAHNAARFRPGDWVHLGPVNPSRQIARISGTTFWLTSDISGAVAATMRLADTPVGARTLRIASQPETSAMPDQALVPGAQLTITQGAVTDRGIIESVQAEPLDTSPAITTYRVTFRNGLKQGFSLDPGGGTAPAVSSHEFTVTVSLAPSSTSYINLGIDPAHPRFILAAMADDPLVSVEFVEPLPASPVTKSSLAAHPLAALSGAVNEDLTTLASNHFEQAIDTLRDVDDVNLVSVPDCLRLTAPQPQTVQQAVIKHCEQLADRFAVLDALPGLPLSGTGSIRTQRDGLDSTRGYAGLYYPWLRVQPPTPGPLIIVPPSGHVCGIVARSDNTRGVHKAPANEIVNGALGVERTMSDVDQGQLNFVKNINVIRVFQTGGRPVLNGARTTATDRNWQYVNIRRLFLYLEESIQEGIRWAVFEPNNLGLWEKLRRSITDFLMRAWRDGAMFGATPKEAFYVRIDEALNPPSDRALGRLTIEIGIKPSYPAEFIIVRIGIWQGGSAVSES